MKKVLLVAAILAVAASPALAAAKAKVKKVEAPKSAKVQTVNPLQAGACVVGTVVSLPFALVAAATKTPNVAKPLTASCPA